MKTGRGVNNLTVRKDKQKEREMISEDDKLLEEYFRLLGFSILHVNRPKSANGVDMWVRKNGKPISVEIKKARKQKSGMIQVDPVSKPRQKDDLIAVIVNPDYVLIQPMSEHLKLCSPKGTRQFTWSSG